MSNASIRQSLVSLSDVFVVGEGVDRYVTDRFVLWRLSDAPAKLRDALSVVSEGLYDLNASGVKSGRTGVDLPKLAQLLDAVKVTDLDARNLSPMPIVLDHGKDGARVWEAPDGSVVALNARLDFTGGYRLCLADSGRQVSILRRDEQIGTVMCVRISDEARDAARRLAASDTFPRAKGVAA